MGDGRWEMGEVSGEEKNGLYELYNFITL